MVPCFFTSSAIDLLQVVLDLPVLLFPCGFQSKAFLVTLLVCFRRVCPIHIHFRLAISLLMLCWSVLYNLLCTKYHIQLAVQQILYYLLFSKYLIFCHYFINSTNIVMKDNKERETKYNYYLYLPQEIVPPPSLYGRHQNSTERNEQPLFMIQC